MEFKCLGNTETAGGGFNEHFRFFLPQQDGAAWRLRWGPESGRNGAEHWHRHLLALSIWEGFPGFRKTGSSTVFKSKRALPQTRLRRRSPGVRAESRPSQRPVPVPSKSKQMAGVWSSFLLTSS